MGAPMASQMAGSGEPSETVTSPSGLRSPADQGHAQRSSPPNSRALRSSSGTRNEAAKCA
jgi:hypothetical protein